MCEVGDEFAVVSREAEKCLELVDCCRSWILEQDSSLSCVWSDLSLCDFVAEKDDCCLCDFAFA